ncbi:hypothetical protein Hanom_Chr03g00242701 [Helianthus anomalus]
MFTSNCRRCPLPLKFMSFVSNVSKSCTVCPLSLTQFIFCCIWLPKGILVFLPYLFNIILKIKKIIYSPFYLQHQCTCNTP